MTSLHLQSQHWRSLRAASVPLISILILSSLLLLLLQRPLGDVGPSIPSVASSGAALPAGTSARAEPALVVVNGASISEEMLEEAVAIDSAMGRLFHGDGGVERGVLLERLINQQLVLQAAQDAGFSVSPSDEDAAWASFLARAGQTETTLEEALAQENLSLTQFRSAFSDLVLVERFTREQAAAQGVDVAGYLRLLQGQARVSVGPEGGLLLATASAQAPQPAGREAVAASAPSAEHTDQQPPMTTNPDVVDTTQDASVWRPIPFVPAQQAEEQDTEPAVSSEVQVSAGQAEQIVIGTALGNRAPDFQIPLVNGEGVLGLADLAGKPTLLSFWTTWCPYCLRQTPVLVEAYKRWAAKGVQFVGVDVGETSSQVLPYLETHGIEYPIGLDENSQIAAEYAVRGFPTTYFLDAEGKITARHIGQLTAEQLDSYLSQMFEN